jgi:hypothetical protein
MSKLHKKMVALGDMSQHTYADVVAACGEPKETHAASFSDIGEGTRSTWSDGVFTITFNFDGEGHYCGIYHHRNWSPYLWLSALTLVIIAAFLLWGAWARKNAADSVGSADGVETLLLENESVWKNDATAGLCLLDLNFDGTPELLTTDADVVWYESDGMYFFGPSRVSVWSLSGGKVTSLGGYETDEYCFMATLHLYTAASGAKGWYFTSGEDVWLLTLSNAGVVTTQADQMPDTSGGDVSERLLRNESWVTVSGTPADEETVRADISAVAAEYFG